MDYRQYYHLESYLLDIVRSRFIEQGYLSAFDFFCIIIWKANRAKSKIAKRLLEKANTDNLDVAVYTLTAGLYQQSSAKQRLCYLWEKWGFRLPMASAILAMLYPDEFTIYDVRVCNSIDDYHELGNCTKFEKLWQDYGNFKRKVEDEGIGLTFREKDQYLWGKSFYNDLVKDINCRFGRQNEGIPENSTP